MIARVSRNSMPILRMILMPLTGAGLIKSWMFSGYGPTHITTCFWEKHKLFYIQVYKGANNMLRANMANPDAVRRMRVDEGTRCRPVSEFDPFKTLDPETCIVTFVRHPFGT